MKIVPTIRLEGGKPGSVEAFPAGAPVDLADAEAQSLVDRGLAVKAAPAKGAPPKGKGD